MRPWTLLGVALAAVGVAACGDDPPSARPDGLAEVRDVFDDDLAELGLRLTDRGGVVDAARGYQPAPDGSHLSLYVEPVDEDAPPEDYVDDILATARLLAPESFERWSGIETFDVCQEAPASVDDADVPETYSRFDLSRARADDIDWDALTLPDLLALASQEGDEGVALYVEPVIRETDAFAAAVRDAGLSP